MTVRSTFIPCLRYEDAPAAIDFLCSAFGFKKKVVNTDSQDPTIVHHAELEHNGCVIMVSSVVESDFSKVLTTVKEASGSTQSVYVVLDEDVAAHAERARLAGAELFMEPEAQDYGGSCYGAVDLEGNAWSFGDYDPSASSG